MELQADIARRVKKDSKAGLPPGGAAGRVLQKASPDDYDAAWMPSPALPDGGTVGQVLTKRSYVDGDADWETSAGATGASGLYGGSANTTVPNATLTNLDWPTLSLGTALLDLSTITIPTVLADGIYTFDFVVNNSGVAGGGILIEFPAVATDTPYLGLAGGDLLTIAATTVTLGLSLTSFLHAGSSIELKAEQTSGGSVAVNFVSVTVTRIA